MIRKLARLAAALVFIGIAIWLAAGGYLLVRDAPQTSDVVLVLDGENNFRVQRALELLHAAYAPLVILDTVDTEVIFGQPKSQIAQRFIDSLPPADRARFRVCVVRANSTLEEAHAARPCLESAAARRVLIATSEEHSLRALLILRHELPQFQFSVAAARDPMTYGPRWWQHRQWAKYYLEESVRLLWFEAVDRWR